MADLWTIFSSIFVFAFGVFCIIFGGFTAYFGTGRSRNIGGSLILFGLIALLIVGWFTGVLGFSTPGDITWEMGIVVEAIIAIVAAIVGGGASLVIFLAAIMKS
jgi:hypothetical protein